MIGKILVPLDGSELSHRILSSVRRLLIRQDAEIKLVRVLTRDEARRGEEAVREARGHLGRVVELLTAGGARASLDVLAGEPADEILAYAEGFGPSLIALASHGRSGPSRWLRGSVCERLLRASRFPLLLTNPVASGPVDWRTNESRESRELAAELSFGRILVPLDGSETAAAVLPLVREVALLYGSAVVLLHVREGTSVTVEPFCRRLDGVKTTTRTAEGSPAAAILDVAAEGLFDLIALTTHGRSGPSRWAFGSTAETVLRHASSPLLVQRST